MRALDTFAGLMPWFWYILAAAVLVAAVIRTMVDRRTRRRKRAELVARTRARGSSGQR